MTLSSVIMLLSPISICSNMGDPPDISHLPLPEAKIKFCLSEK